MGSTVTAPQLAREAQRAERAERVWALKRDAVSFPKIVERLRAEGYRISLGTAHRDFTAQLKLHQVPAEQVNEYRALHVARLEDLYTYAKVEVAGNTGERRLKAINTAVNVLERQARLLGLDAPVRVEGEVTVRQQTADDLVAELESILGKAPTELPVTT